MSTMKVLIVDDEPLARDRLRRMLENMSGYEVLAEGANGKEAVDICQQQQPDIVLMDIRMPGMDGLEAAQHLAELDSPPAVIFCTAYGEYALDAFDVQAVGYLLKPVRLAMLDDALEKAQKTNRAQLAILKEGLASEAGPDNVDKGRSHISSKTRRGLELVPVDDVIYFMADHKYVTVYHENGELLIDDTLKELEQEFGNRFIRIHRNSLVSVKRITGMARNAEGVHQIVLQGLDEQVIVSRRHVSELRKMLQLL